MRVLSDEKIGAAVYASHVDITLSDAIALTRAIEAAVRAELAGQEPVAWCDINRISFVGDALRETAHSDFSSYHCVPLFAAPVVQPDDLKDAERYRWLRKENAKTYEEGALFVGYDNEQGGDWIGCDLDAAIDAAMAAEKETSPK